MVKTAFLYPIKKVKVPARSRREGNKCREWLVNKCGLGMIKMSCN